MIEGAYYSQVESLLKFFALTEDALEFPVLLSLLISKIEQISIDDPHSLFASLAATTSTISIAKSLCLLLKRAGESKKSPVKESYKNFYGAITQVAKNERIFRKVM